METASETGLKCEWCECDSTVLYSLYKPTQNEWGDYTCLNCLGERFQAWWGVPYYLVKAKSSTGE